MTDQVQTSLTSPAAVMRRANFRRGLADARAGRPPRFDEFNDGYWAYERGRLFAFIAPTSMPLFVSGELNPRAVALFEAAERRSLIP